MTERKGIWEEDERGMRMRRERHEDMRAGWKKCATLFNSLKSVCAFQRWKVSRENFALQFQSFDSDFRFRFSIGENLNFRFFGRWTGYKAGVPQAMRVSSRCCGAKLPQVSYESIVSLLWCKVLCARKINVAQLPQAMRASSHCCGEKCCALVKYE